MRTAVEHLEAAVADLTGARNDLDRQIAVLRRTIQELSRGAVATVNPVPTANPPHAQVGRTVKEIILELGLTKPYFTLDEVVAAANAEGNDAKPESISSILSRMKRTGDVQGVRRGTYALHVPENSEAPDFSGASDHTTSSAVAAAGPDRREGDGPGADHFDHHPAPVGPD